MPNTVQYVVEVLKQGDGAAIAGKEFAAVQQQMVSAQKVAAQTSTAFSAQNSQLKNLGLASKALRADMHALAGSLTLVGLNAAPQLTAGVYTATAAFKALKATSTLLGLQLSAAIPIMGAVAAAAGGTAYAWYTYNEAQKRLLETEKNLRLQDVSLAESLKNTIAIQVRHSVITRELADVLLTLRNRYLEVKDAAAQAAGIEGLSKTLRAAGPLVDVKLFQTQATGREQIGQAQSAFNAAQLAVSYEQELVNFDQYLALREKKAKEASDVTIQYLREMLIDANQYEAAAIGAQIQVTEINLKTALEGLDKERFAHIKQDNAAANAALLERAQNEMAALRSIGDLQRQIADANLTGVAKLIAANNAQYEQRINQISQMKSLGEDEYFALIGLAKQLRDVDEARIAYENSSLGKANQDIIDFTEQSKRIISQGLASGIVDAFRTGKFEADKFFADLFAQIAQIALEKSILRLLDSLFSTAALGGQFASLAALGGQFSLIKAAGGVPGVSSVSAPTYFPNFNVLAGEAGREILTVLSKPRMMDIGGLAAQVGYAGPNRLAIADADQLASRMGRGGAGGEITIRLVPSPESRAEIIHSSIEGAVVRVVQDAQRDTPINSAIRKVLA